MMATGMLQRKRKCQCVVAFVDSRASSLVIGFGVVVMVIVMALPLAIGVAMLLIIERGEELVIM